MGTSCRGMEGNRRELEESGGQLDGRGGEKSGPGVIGGNKFKKWNLYLS